MPHSVASDLGLHCLPMSFKRTLKGLYRSKKSKVCHEFLNPETNRLDPDQTAPPI